MISLIARLIGLLANLFILVVIVESILSYFVSPYHPLRRTLEQIVEPFLTPIRKVVPLVGTLDFSPLILIVLVYIISSVLINILNTL